MDIVDDSAEARKARGAFFTPPTVTSFTVEWPNRSGKDQVLEPIADVRAFVRAAAEGQQSRRRRSHPGP